MNPLQETGGHIEQSNEDTRPTMLDLWRMYPAIQNVAMIEAPGIPYVRVVYAFCGFPVTQQEFDAVLNTFNRLTGCHYVQDDIAGVQIVLPDEHLPCHPERSEGSAWRVSNV
ncbi:MAG TPA: hypothetical protein VFQ36_13610 [Ktedonobacteraceae bacterium]|nr:hypothetical protein [Ktedonobacteraceae bacterium]